MTRSPNGDEGRHGATDSPAVTRRRLLGAAGALAVGTGLAGCAGGPAGGATLGDRPAYSRWIGAEHLQRATDTGEGFVFVRTDFETFRDIDGSGSSLERFGTDAEDADGYELAIAPLFGTVAFLLVGSLGLIPYGQAAAKVMGSVQAGMGSGGGATEPETPHTIDSGLLVGSLVVFQGSLDVDALEADATGFEPAEEYGDYRIYEGTGGGGSLFDTSDLAFAVGEDAVLFPVPDSNLREADGWRSLDSAAVLRSHIDVAAGDAEEGAEADDDVDWILRAGGTEAFAFGGHGLDEAAVDRTGEAEPEGPELGTLDALVADAGDFALSASYAAADVLVRAEAGFAYPEASARPEEAAFEELVADASSSSVSVDGSRVQVEGEWAGEGPTTSS